jgi:tripartite-type tricarboxylate transporter receptor subunit TctC
MAAATFFASVLSFGISGAQAQWKPTETVEIMVHSKPGSSPDVVARTIQKIWQDEGIVEVPVTIRNVDTQSAGFSYLKQQDGDPHKLTVSSTGTISAKVLGTTDTGFRDLTPISLLMSEFTALAVPTDSPFETGADFVAKLKEDPTAISIGTGGARGNPNHTHVARVAKAAGIDPRALKMVVFSSGADARSQVIGGHIDAVTTSVGSMLGQMESGLLKIIAVAAPERIAGADIPTWRELGFDVVNSNWRWGGATSGLTDEQIAFWEDAFRKATETEVWKTFVKSQEADSTYLDHEETLAFFEEEEAVLTELLTELDLVKKN